MAKARLIASEIFADEWFGPLSPFEQVLWIGLFARCADDQGRLIDNPILIRAAVFPYKDLPVAEIEAGLRKFATDRKVIRYQADGKHLVQLVNWWDHQRPQWASPSAYEPPGGWQDRIRTRSGDAYIEHNWKDCAPFTWQDNLVMPPELTETDSGGTTNLSSKSKLQVNVPKEDLSPPTSGGNEPEPTKPLRQLSLKDQKRAELEQYFAEVTQLPPPKRETKSQKASAAELWWNPLRDILDVANWDLPAAKALVSEAVSRLGTNGMTISSPKSIGKTVLAICAEEKRGHSPQTTPAVAAGLRVLMRLQQETANGREG